ncbi:hypothetical protein L9W92_09155 [Pelotomaculum terephthalicicum JT]|uniref:hypothetical protein n=1 Tax=Pelotomaculum TaxID=191373 RepID=UPI0009D03280|nr:MULTISPECIES: hypothetical protein [Pelotomaculum]MCG9968218.1 hypothetical protein [Pelotomaculum terephthalicicum JT]OPX89121.1 MAG: hypothetical protein A4E54_01104 [Pelotomaculum sp. PtaB.Bin117]
MNTPLLLVQIPPQDEQQSEAASAVIETEIIAIAVFGKDIDVPLTVSTQRVFDAEKPFRFPTEITQGATKTRIVYRYTLAQWHELLETTTLPITPAALKQLMIPMLLYMKQNFPDIFGDIEYDREFDPDQYAELYPME